jgi:hypothetical protein
MRQIYDYIFGHSWLMKELNLKENEEYLVVEEVGELRKGDVVRLVGFSDIDNHYGIFVFYDSQGQILEVSGDYAGPDHSSTNRMRTALTKVN